MRIAFTGSHRVGKTTLAEAIAGYLPNYDLKNEPYLQLEEMGYLFSEIPTYDDYVEQFDYSVKQIADSGNDVIFDRCPFDLLAYIFVTNKNENLQTRYNQMISAMSQTDILIFVPIDTPDLIICQESDLPDLRYEVNAILQNWIKDISIEILEVKGTIENRINQIQNRIDRAKE